MLVFGRMPGQSVVFALPDGRLLGVRLDTHRKAAPYAKMVIDAPQDVRIYRGELVPNLTELLFQPTEVVDA